MIGHLEPDILECEGSWTLGNSTSIKAIGGDGGFLCIDILKPVKVLRIQQLKNKITILTQWIYID